MGPGGRFGGRAAIAGKRLSESQTVERTTEVGLVSTRTAGQFKVFVQIQVVCEHVEIPANVARQQGAQNFPPASPPDGARDATPQSGPRRFLGHQIADTLDVDAADVGGQLAERARLRAENVPCTRQHQNVGERALGLAQTCISFNEFTRILDAIEPGLQEPDVPFIVRRNDNRNAVGAGKRLDGEFHKGRRDVLFGRNELPPVSFYDVSRTHVHCRVFAATNRERTTVHEIACDRAPGDLAHTSPESRFGSGRGFIGKANDVEALPRVDHRVRSRRTAERPRFRQAEVGRSGQDHAVAARGFGNFELGEERFVEDLTRLVEAPEGIPRPDESKLEVEGAGERPAVENGLKPTPQPIPSPGDDDQVSSHGH